MPFLLKIDSSNGVYKFCDTLGLKKKVTDTILFSSKKANHSK